jgi:hypothetical protein
VGLLSECRVDIVTYNEIVNYEHREMMVAVASECRISKTKARPIAQPIANCDNSRLD